MLVAKTPRMKTLLPVAILSTLAACGSGDKTDSSSSAPAPRSAKLMTESARPTSTAKPAATSAAAKPAEPPAASTTAAAAASDRECPETEKGKRACTAPEFQKAWQKEKSPTTFPSSAKYTVSGKVTKVEITDKSKGETGDVRVYLKGDTKDVAFKFEADNKDLAAASKLKVGADAKFTCSFGGLEEIGTVTLEKCAL